MSEMSSASPETAWHNGEFVDANRLFVSVDDIGFRQGVVAVERMRTYGGRVAALEAHVVRWRRTLEELYLTTPVDLETIRQRVVMLLERNRRWIDQVGDCGIVMLATPGSAGYQATGHGAQGDHSNEMMHLLKLNHPRIEQHRQAGQRLFITNVEQPSGKCWPRDIKVRCRLHYYLADQQAREHHPDAVGLLIDHDGTVTETSVANIAIVRSGKVLAPPLEQVLPGITQQIVEEACRKIGMMWESERLWPAEIREADEVWLMGTDGGLWFASHVDGHPIGGDAPAMHFRKALAAFDQLVRE